MNALQTILVNLTIIRYFAIKEKDYGHPDISLLLEEIHDIFQRPNELLNNYVKAIHQHVNQLIQELEAIRDNEETSQLNQKLINSLIEELHNLGSVQNTTSLKTAELIF